jgi:hypothetical protein
MMVKLKKLLPKTFGATNTPHTFVLKKDGAAFKVAYIGAIDDNTKDASSGHKEVCRRCGVDALLANQGSCYSKN